MSGWIGYVIAVGVSALICLALMVRAERRNRQRGLPSDGGSEPYGDSGGYLWSQFGSHHSAHNHCGHLDGGGSGGGGCDGGGGDGGSSF